MLVLLDIESRSVAATLFMQSIALNFYQQDMESAVY